MGPRQALRERPRMSTPTDASVYPDEQPPKRFETIEQQADYLHRIVAAFVFGLVPLAATIQQLAGWREVFDRFPLLASPGYHALRTYFGWPEVERAPCFIEPTYVKLDRLEERDDGCEDIV